MIANIQIHSAANPHGICAFTCSRWERFALCSAFMFFTYDRQIDWWTLNLLPIDMLRRFCFALSVKTVCLLLVYYSLQYGANVNESDLALLHHSHAECMCLKSFRRHVRVKCIHHTIEMTIEWREMDVCVFYALEVSFCRGHICGIYRSDFKLISISKIQKKDIIHRQAIAYLNDIHFCVRLSIIDSISLVSSMSNIILRFFLSAQSRISHATL